MTRRARQRLSPLSTEDLEMARAFHDSERADASDRSRRRWGSRCATAGDSPRRRGKAISSAGPAKTPARTHAVERTMEPAVGSRNGLSQHGTPGESTGQREDARVTHPLDGARLNVA